MKLNKKILREFAVLTDQQLNQTLSEQETDRLLALMTEYPELAEILADNVRMDGLIRDSVEMNEPLAQSVCPQSSDKKHYTYQRFVTWSRLWLVATSILGVLLGGTLTVLFWPVKNDTSVPKITLATMVETQNCVWRESSYATEKGSRLGAGRLDLLAGIATIHFDCGAVLSLESPSQLEVIDEKRCLLKEGRCVVTAEPTTAKGFILETPYVTVEDEGTKFSLDVRGQSADVSVLEGKVRTWCPHSGENQRLKKDENASFGQPIKYKPLVPKKGNTSPTTIQLTTASPGGKEAWVVIDTYLISEAKRVKEVPHWNDFLLIKRGGYPDNTPRPRADRRAIFGIDLAPLKESRIEKVQMRLCFGDTGIGFMTFIPDSRFVVYGLKDDAGDAWNENKITWQTLPGNNSDQELDKSVYVPVGEFTIPKGVTEKTIILCGEELKKYILGDKNHFVTFVVVDETPASIGESYVFGIAGRQHSHYSPPTLIISCAKEKEK